MRARNACALVGLSVLLANCSRWQLAPASVEPVVLADEVTCEMITALVDQDDVDEANSSDLDCVGKAITAAARRGLELT